MSVGAFVPINANDDNGSPITNEIPTDRDFDTNLDFNTAQPFLDPDLVPATVTVNPNVGLPGTVSISVGPESVGQIRLWDDPWRQNHWQGVYTMAQLPKTFYMEGIESSWAQRDLTVIARYSFVGANGQVVAAGSDQLAVSVTPIVNFLSIGTRGPNGTIFLSAPDPDNPNVYINYGVHTLGYLGYKGVVFDAGAFTRGVSGSLRFIQNAGVPGEFVAVVNGVPPIEQGGGWGDGWTYTQASGRAAQNSVLIDPTTNMPAPDAVLDSSQAPPSPDYHTNDWREFVNGDLVTISDQDDPAWALMATYPNGDSVPDVWKARDLTRIAVRHNFRMYLVWRFPNTGPNGNQTVIYTLATRDWYATFRGDTYVDGRGVTAIGAGAGVFEPDPADLTNHDDPIVIPPRFNACVSIR
jgi:hypothetical protein